MTAIKLGTIEQALEQLRAGRPILVADDADRENEADAIISAELTTPEWLAWIIRHSSGYLCAPMTNARADMLHLPLMVPNSQDERRTAYTVTVDAASGVTTGISAADRTRTLHVLAGRGSGPDDLIRPGHVLPLRAVPGGVLHRGGHTEAAVDLTRLAGLTPVAGIAEMIKDDGTMMRLPDAATIAQQEGLVLVTIADLRAWRRAHGDDGPVEAPSEPARRVERTGRAKLPTRHGDFEIVGYRDLKTGASHVALVSAKTAAARLDGDDAAGPSRKPGGLPQTVAPMPTGKEAVGFAERRTAPDGGTSEDNSPVLVRVHSECLTGDTFDSLRCDCGAQLAAAMERCSEEGGVVVYLRGQEGRGIGLLAKIEAYRLQDQGRDTVDANLELGWPADRREYGAAAAILADLGIGRVRLLTNNPAKVQGLRAHGVEVAAVESIVVGRTAQNARYLKTKAERMGHVIPPAGSFGNELAGEPGGEDLDAKGNEKKEARA